MSDTSGSGQPQDPQTEPIPSTQPQPAADPGYWQQQAQHVQPGVPYPAQPGHYAPAAPTQYALDHPKATTVLVLGILGLVACGVFAPFAWAMGRRTLAEIDASNGRLGGRGQTNAGYICGIIGSVLLGVGILVMVLFLSIGIIGLSVGSNA